MDRPSILIVEDEAIVALDLKLNLQSFGYEVCGTAASGEQAIDAVEATRPDLVLMDVRLQGDIDGIQTAERIRARRAVPLVFLTSHSDDETVRRAARTAPYGYLTKPYQPKELRAGIEVALTKSRMERQLREADRWFARALQCVSDGVILTDGDARVRFLNPAAELLTGWELDAAVGRPIDEVVQRHGTQALCDGAGARVRAALHEGRPSGVVHAMPIVSRRGEPVLVDETAGPVRDDDNAALGAVLVLRDARQRLAQETRLRESEARFRNAFDFAPLGMALVSFGGGLLQVNDALCRLLARTRDELLSSDFNALTPPDEQPHIRDRLQALGDPASTVVQFETRLCHARDAVPLPVLLSVSVLHDGQTPTCHLVQVHDLSEQKRAAEQMAALADERMRRAASDLANTSKTEFLSRVSHEMRTPLNAVLGFAQLLQGDSERRDAGTVHAYAGHIRAAGEHLLALVSDLLDLNQAVQGRLQLTLVPTPLAQVLDESWRLLEQDAARRGVQLDNGVDAAIAVRADARRLRQVLLNLLSNAIKYNRSGGRVEIRADNAASDRVLLRIADQGIGITPEQMQRLFQPFDRLGAEHSRVPGIGLGLVIARGLVQELGGGLEVDSASGAGTTITLTLQRA